MSRRAADPVAAQYERWVYPQPLADLEAPEVRGRRDGGDPTANWYTFWPDRAPRDDLDILIAGCGANAAARYALNHPQARVVGLDLSAASLAHEQVLKDKHRLANLTLQQGRMEDVGTLGRTFDFIECSGVLHHLPDPVAGLAALGRVLRPAGTIAIMVYGAYPRAAIYMLRDMFQLLGLDQSEADVAMVKGVLAALPDGHPAQESLRRTRDTQFDAGLVDTFLHPQDRAYTVGECLELVRAAGLAFMGWWDNLLRYAEGQIGVGSALYRRINTLPDEVIWQVMELYGGIVGQHTFCACLPTRPQSSYRVDFASEALLDYVPVRRSQEVAVAHAPEGSIAVQRANLPAYILTPTATALYRQIDGAKSVRACGEAALPGLSAAERAALCRDAFQYLWRLSYVFLRVPAA